jgi:hypothetical protein
VSNIYCVVFLFLVCFSSSCVPLCYPFLWIFRFLLTLRYSLTFYTKITKDIKRNLKFPDLDSFHRIYVVDVDNKQRTADP